MKTCIIILNYKTYEMTLRLIENVEKIDRNKQLGIIVVDNNSGNESDKVLAKEANRGLRYHYLSSKENRGYASGNNIGLKYATELGFDYAIISNNDIEILGMNDIKYMLDMFESNKNMAVVSPKIVDQYGKVDPPIYLNRPTLWDFTLGMLYAHKRRYRCDVNKSMRIYAPRGSFMMVKLSTLRDVGFLDEGTFLYYEEPILAEKITLVGGECWHCGEAKVIHKHGKTISTSLKKKNTCKIMCESFDYYLATYRKINWLARKICVSFRWLCYMIRR